jgi:radical SAM protein with 4Fe4S-binding SPASM domain
MRPSRSDIEQIFEGRRTVLYAHDLRESLLMDNVSPLSCDFTLSDACQHKCHFCVDDRNEVSGPIMSEEDAFRILTQLRKLGVMSVNFEGGGEPTIAPAFVAAMRHAHGSGMHVGLITNGGMLHKEEIANTLLDCARYVRISLDAVSPETHETSHGVKGQFNKIVESIKELVRRRDAKTSSRSPYEKLPVIGLGYLIDENTFQGMHHALALGEHTGVDYVSYRPMHSDKKYGGYYLRDDMNFAHSQALKRVSEVEGGSRVYAAIDWPTSKYVPTKKCFAHRGKITVGATGDVYTCCNKRYNQDYSFGQLRPDVPLERLWSGPKRKDVIKRLENALQDMSQHCSSCNSDDLNRTYVEMKRPNLHHRFMG